MPRQTYKVSVQPGQRGHSCDEAGALRGPCGAAGCLRERGRSGSGSMHGGVSDTPQGGQCGLSTKQRNATQRTNVVGEGLRLCGRHFLPKVGPQAVTHDREWGKGLVAHILGVAPRDAIHVWRSTLLGHLLDETLCSAFHKLMQQQQRSSSSSSSTWLVTWKPCANSKSTCATNNNAPSRWAPRCKHVAAAQQTEHCGSFDPASESPNG